MPRSKDLALADRNRRIIEMIAEGYSYQVIADNFGLSKQRIAQLNSEYQELVTDDSYRDLLRTRMEHIEEELFRIFRGPGKLMVSPGGSIIYEKNPDGTLDFSRPVYDPYAKTDIAAQLIKVHERLSKSYGLDRPRQRETDQSGEVQAWVEYIQQLDEENKQLKERLKVIEGTVPAEIVSGDLLVASES